MPTCPTFRARTNPTTGVVYHWVCGISYKGESLINKYTNRKLYCAHDCLLPSIVPAASVSKTNSLFCFTFFQNCVARAPPLYFIRSWVALSFKVCLSVRHPWHLTRSPLRIIYKGIDALYWPRVINYQLPPPHSVLYWPSTQLHHLVTHSWANWI